MKLRLFILLVLFVATATYLPTQAATEEMLEPDGATGSECAVDVKLELEGEHSIAPGDYVTPVATIRNSGSRDLVDLVCDWSASVSPYGVSSGNTFFTVGDNRATCETSYTLDDEVTDTSTMVTLDVRATCKGRLVTMVSKSLTLEIPQNGDDADTGTADPEDSDDSTDDSATDADSQDATQNTSTTDDVDTADQNSSADNSGDTTDQTTDDIANQLTASGGGCSLVITK